MRYFITFSYDGSMYNGYQKQPNKKTIQGELEKVLFKINGNKAVIVSATGRTDAGVHALNQKAHFDLERNYNIDKLKQSLNKMLPDDIYVKSVQLVEQDFHARFNVKSKEYIYRINIGEYNPLEKNYIYQYNNSLDIIEMERALKYLEGTHNFKSFTKSNVEREDYTRTIIQTNIIKNDNEIVVYLKGTGFLRYMVRNIVGFLIEIGEGNRKSEDILEVLNALDRTKAGKTAPPNGLYLNDVFY